MTHEQRLRYTNAILVVSPKFLSFLSSQLFEVCEVHTMSHRSVYFRRVEKNRRTHLSCFLSRETSVNTPTQIKKILAHVIKKCLKALS